MEFKKEIARPKEKELIEGIEGYLKKIGYKPDIFVHCEDKKLLISRCDFKLDLKPGLYSEDRVKKSVHAYLSENGYTLHPIPETKAHNVQKGDPFLRLNVVVPKTRRPRVNLTFLRDD